MNDDLKAIRNQACWAEQLHPVAGAVMKLCDYIDKLEERIAELEKEEDSE